MELAFQIFLYLCVVAFAGSIFRKAGYSGWLGLLLLVPLVNVIWIVYFATTKWPIEQELEGKLADTAVTDHEGADRLHRRAVNLAQQGDIPQALELYELAAQQYAKRAEEAQAAARHLRDQAAGA